MKIKFINNEAKKLYLNAEQKALTPDVFKEDAGLDIRWMTNNMTIVPGLRIKIPTGISIALPKNWVGILKDRSGIANKSNIVVHAGVIDHSYRGELSVIIQNHGPEAIDFKYGDRFAQLLVVRRYTKKVKFVTSLEETLRGSKGFGSTGKE